MDGNLSFDPSTLTDVQNEDGTPFFSEDQIAKLPNLDKFKGERGQALLTKSFMELETFKGANDKTMSEIKADQEKFEAGVAEKFQGHLAPLKKDATDEEKVVYQAKVKTFFQAPEKLEDYDALKVPEGVPMDEEGMKAFKKWGFANNKSVEACQQLLDIQTGMIQRQQEAHDDKQADAAKTTEKLLTKLFGGKEAYVEKCEHIMRMLRQYVNPDWRKFEESMDEPWQEFKTDVYTSGVANNPVIMEVLGAAIDKGVGRAEGKTHVEIVGSTPVEKKHLDKSWEEQNPGVPKP